MPTGSVAYIALTLLPRSPCWSAARTLIGIIALSSRPAVACPRARRKRPERARDGREHNVVDGAADRVLDALVVVEVAADPGEAPVGADLDVEGRVRRGDAGASERADGLEASTRSAPAMRRGWRKTARTPRKASAGVVARSARARPRTSASVGSGPGTQASGEGEGASGFASKRTVVMSTPETPSIRQWWLLVTIPKRPPSRPSTSHISHIGFERSRRWEKMRAASVRSCCSEPGSGSAVWRTW